VKIKRARVSHVINILFEEMNHYMELVKENSFKIKKKENKNELKILFLKKQNKLSNN
jgi:hypothetical protein